MYTPINHELVSQALHESIPNIVDKVPQGGDPPDQLHHFEPPENIKKNNQWNWNKMRNLQFGFVFFCVLNWMMLFQLEEVFLKLFNSKQNQKKKINEKTMRRKTGNKIEIMLRF